MRLLLLFIDGIGIGADDPDINPLASFPDLWPVQNGTTLRADLAYKALDACLGVGGLPQSATGQTSLLTGVNAPRLLGKHLPGFPSRRLVDILKRESLFVKLQRGGRSFLFANAYRHPEDIAPTSRLSVTSHAYRAAGKPFLSLDHLRRKEALYHDFTHQSLISSGYRAPQYHPREAAEVLLEVSRKHDFTLYEHFLTDVLAHRAEKIAIIRHLERLQLFIEALLDLTDAERTAVLITSDHGNVEDLRVKTHTRHPVPLIWTHRSRLRFQPRFDDITGITPWILDNLECPA